MKYIGKIGSVQILLSIVCTCIFYIWIDSKDMNSKITATADFNFFSFSDTCGFTLNNKPNNNMSKIMFSIQGNFRCLTII
jgi:hypothetical protein